jgi:hypothetical protein
MEESTQKPCADKLGFDTKQQANAAAVVAYLQHGTKLTVYKCTHCKLWHLATDTDS